MVVEDERTADLFTSAMKNHGAVWGERGMDPAPVRIGEAFELEPCVPPNWPFATEDKPCPRVELWPENELAVELVFVGLPEHTRPMISDYIDALSHGRHPDDLAAAVIRAVRCLQSEAVASWMRKQFEEGSKA
jgi:hypothetical protein